jgi:hypothetical protein
MPLIHGQDVGASELEREVSAWDAVRFARLCNAIAWANAWRGTQALPAFTERVNVADNGIDAEWQGEFSAQNLQPSGLLTPGVNVFQYKKRETTEQSRARIAASLVDVLRGAIIDVEKRARITLNSYVLFTNVDLTTDQHDCIRAAVADGLAEGQVNVGIIAAADLAAMLNELPHLRSAFIATGAFRSWGESWEAHQRVIAFPQIALTGRDQDLATLRSWVNDPEVRVVALSGAHMMGKTRLLLEATRERDAGLVEALDRQTLNLDQIRRLEGTGREVIVLVNDPDPQQARRLAEETLARSGIKLVLALPTAEAAPAPSFGQDSRIRTLALTALPPDPSRQLLTAANANLDFSLASWILDQADGVPGVILAAAHAGSNLRRDGGSFVEQVATAFENDIHTRLTEDQRNALSILALMSHVGIERAARAEAEMLCRQFRQFGVDLHVVLNAIEPLRAAGLLRIDGSYAEVVPPPLANRLAGRMMRGRSEAVRATFAGLRDPARQRFIRRLLLLQGDEARNFWDDLLGNRGAFTSLDGIIADSALFRFAAAANGGRSAPILRRLLQEATVEQRRSIHGDARRHLVLAIEEMLFREGTGESALYSLALLAEAENEDWRDNASGVFKEAFYPLHSQVPLPLVQRLGVLRTLLAPGRSVSLTCLAIDAAADTTEQPAITLRHSIAATPLGGGPQMTWGEVWRYEGDCLDLLVEALSHDGAEVGRRAAQRLPRMLSHLISRGLHERALSHLRAIVDRAIAGDRIFDLTELASSIRWCRWALRDQAHGGSEANAAVIAELGAFLTRFETADFATRLRLWIGGWSLDFEDIDASIRATSEAITALAQEACANPALLDEALVDWLSTQAAHTGRFWHEVGRQDVQAVFRSRVRELGLHDRGVQSLVTYTLGWSTRDRDGARAFFAEVAADDATAARAILIGTLQVDAPDTGAERITQLLRDRRIGLDRIDQALAGQWLEQVSETALVDVLSLLAGHDMEGFSGVPRLLWCRGHSIGMTAGLLTNFAWCYLEAHPITSQHLADYYSDLLAARLVALDRERAFALFERVIRDGRLGQRWNPLRARPQQEFWKALTEIDRPRVVTIMLDASRSGEEARWNVQWNLPNLIDLEADAGLLGDHAARGLEMATTVCHAITGGRPGFWPIAFRIIDLHPTNADLRGELEGRIEQFGQTIHGLHSEHLNRCLEDVEHARQLRGATGPVRAWLDDYADRLRRCIDEQRRGEADERVNRT